GSSPVPPIEKPCIRAFLLLQQATMVSPWQGLTPKLRRDHRPETLVTRPGTDASSEENPWEPAVGAGTGQRSPSYRRAASAPDLQRVLLGLTRSGSEPGLTSL